MSIQETMMDIQKEEKLLQKSIEETKIDMQKEEKLLQMSIEETKCKIDIKKEVWPDKKEDEVTNNKTYKFCMYVFLFVAASEILSKHL